MKPHALIAILDDDEGVREALANLLRSADYRVATFATGAALLRDFDRNPPDCIVTDVQMPKMTGWELLDNITRSGRTTPVILMSADRTEVTPRKPTLSSPHCILLKPFDADELIACVAGSIEAMKKRS